MSPPPFFSCPHLVLSVKMQSLWRAKFAITDVLLDQPTVHMLITAQGENNLPHAVESASTTPSAPTSPTPTARSSSSAAGKVFNLGIRHLVVTAGQIEYNDQKYPVTADLHNLQTTAWLNVATQTYSGSLSYDRGRVGAPHIRPFRQTLRMDFAATRSELDVPSLRIETGHTTLRLRGTVVDYAHPRLTATYQAAIFTPDLARILNSTSIPAAEITTTGSLRYVSGTKRPFLDVIYAQGQLDAPRLLAHFANVATEARHVRASYILEHGNLRVSGVTGYAMGGALKGSFSMADLSTWREAHLAATVRGASLIDLMRFASSKQRQRLGLEGTTNADVQATWAGAFRDTIAHVRARIYGPLRAPSPGTIPVNGFLDARYNGLRHSATFAASSLRTEHANISFRGTIRKNSSLTLQANVRQLGELSPLISALTSTSTSRPANSKAATFDSLQLKGSANFAGQLQGSLMNPRISGHLAGQHVFVKGTYISRVQADIRVQSSEIAIQSASVSDTMNGKLTIHGRFGLHHWSFTRTSPLYIQAKASGLSVPDLLRMAKLKYPLGGKLEAHISVHGSEDNPAGKADIALSAMSPRSANPVKKLLSMRTYFTAHLKGDGNLVQARARLTVQAGKVTAQLAYAPKTEHYAGQISAPSLNLSKLKFARQHGLKLAGLASLSASGKGTVQRPQLDAKLAIPQLQIQGQTVSAVQSEFQVGNQQANFALSSVVTGGYVDAKGNVALRGDYPATASVEVRALPIAPLLAKYEPRLPAELKGQTELQATLNGPLKQPKKITAQVHIPTLNLGYQSVHLALAAPMNLRYANDVLTIGRTELKGTGTNLALEGTIPFKGGQLMNVSAHGSVNLGLLQTVGVGIRSAGRIVLNIVAEGQMAHPKMRGEIQIAGASFLSETLPIAVESLNGKIRVSGTRLDIEQLQGTVGGGNLALTGFYQYAPQSKFSLVVKGQSVRIRYPQGIRTLLDADLTLAGSPGKSTLRGRVLVNRLSLTQQFDIASLIGQFSSQVPSTAPPAFEQNMKLRVAVTSTNALNLTSSKLSIGGNFNLTVAGTGADPVVLGRVALSQGEIFFMGKRYEIQSGTIEFADPVRTEPVLNVYAKTTVNQYNITLNFVGPIDRLRANYTSTPPLSEADIIHLIAFGTTAEQAAASPSVPTSVAAESILAQGVSSQVSGKLEKLTGISQITIDPLVTNSTGGNPGSQIGIQERISGSLLLTFSTSVTNTQAQTVEVQYTTTQHVSVSILRDYNGGYALDVRFRKTF